MTATVLACEPLEGGWDALVGVDGKLVVVVITVTRVTRLYQCECGYRQLAGSAHPPCRHVQAVQDHLQGRQPP